MYKPLEFLHVVEKQKDIHNEIIDVKSDRKTIMLLMKLRPNTSALHKVGNISF